MNLGAFKHPLTDPATAARFWSHVAISPDDGECWPWIGCRKPGGYGDFRGHGAHRISLEIRLGRRIPDGLCALHDPVRCNHTWCVNPRHLRAGTQAENVCDKMLSQLHCVRGHVLPLVPGKYNKRRCRTCQRDLMRAIRAADPLRWRASASPAVEGA